MAECGIRFNSLLKTQAFDYSWMDKVLKNGCKIYKAIYKNKLLDKN